MLVDAIIEHYHAEGWLIMSGIHSGYFNMKKGNTFIAVVHNHSTWLALYHRQTNDKGAVARQKGFDLIESSSIEAMDEFVNLCYSITK